MRPYASLSNGFYLFQPPLATPPGGACSLIAALGLGWGSRGRMWGIASDVPVTDSWTRQLQRGQAVGHCTAPLSQNSPRPLSRKHFGCFEPVTTFLSLSHQQIINMIEYVPP